MIEFYDDLDALIDENNPVDFSSAVVGRKSDAIQVALWWNRGNDSAGGIENVSLGIDSVAILADYEMFNGTEGNGFTSFILARSCGSVGNPGDYQTDFSPISPGNFLSIGDMVSDSVRYIEFCVSIPWDSTIINLTELTIRVGYDNA